MTDTAHGQPQQPGTAIIILSRQLGRGLDTSMLRVLLLDLFVHNFLLGPQT